MRKKSMLLLLTTALMLSLTACSEEQMSEGVAAVGNAASFIMEENADELDELTSEFKEALEEGADVMGSKLSGEEKHGEKNSNDDADTTEVEEDFESKMMNTAGKIALEALKAAMEETEESGE